MNENEMVHEKTCEERREFLLSRLNLIDSKINWLIGLGASIFIALILSVFRYLLNK